MGTKTFKTLYTELSGQIPNLPIPLAKTLLQRAWEAVCNARQWSFLIAEGMYISPAPVTEGSVSITQYSNVVTFDATAVTALTGLTYPLLTERQLRIGTSTYSITDATNLGVDGTVTLDGIVLEATNATSAYTVMKCYYGLPLTRAGVQDTDFLRFNSIYNPINNTYFSVLDGTRQFLDRIDPQRAVSSYPNGMFTFGSSSTGTPQWEMYPNPAFSGHYFVNYQKRFTTQTDTSLFPNVIPDDLVMARGLYEGCLWADANKTLGKEMQGTNWRLLATEHNIKYSNPRPTLTHPLGLLEIAERNDEEMHPQNLITPPFGGVWANSGWLNTLSGQTEGAIDIYGNSVSVIMRLP